VAYFWFFNGNWSAIGTTAQAKEHDDGSHEANGVRGIGDHILKIRPEQRLVARQPREDQNGPATQKSRDIDPIQSLKPVHISHSVLAALGTHGVEGIDAKGRGTHGFKPATN
jgi:hypothetical protein